VSLVPPERAVRPQALAQAMRPVVFPEHLLRQLVEKAPAAYRDIGEPCGRATVVASRATNGVMRHTPRMARVFSAVLSLAVLLGCQGGGSANCPFFFSCVSSQAEADRLNGNSGCDNYKYCPPGCVESRETPWCPAPNEGLIPDAGVPETFPSLLGDASVADVEHEAGSNAVGDSASE
jgi:hypothetical protein